MWLLGIRHHGRRAYWRFLFATLLLRPRKFRYAVELGILGFHYRRVASLL